MSFLQKAVVLRELADNYCSLGTVAVREPIGNGTSAVRSRYQKADEDEAG
jgi:hypothetical protein